MFDCIKELCRLVFQIRRVNSHYFFVHRCVLLIVLFCSPVFSSGLFPWTMLLIKYAVCALRPAKNFPRLFFQILPIPLQDDLPWCRSNPSISLKYEQIARLVLYAPSTLIKEG